MINLIKRSAQGNSKKKWRKQKVFGCLAQDGGPKDMLFVLVLLGGSGKDFDAPAPSYTPIRENCWNQKKSMHLFKVRSYIILLIDENIYIVDDINIYTKSKPAWKPWNSRTNVAKGLIRWPYMLHSLWWSWLSLSLSLSHKCIFS